MADSNDHDKPSSGPGDGQEPNRLSGEEEEAHLAAISDRISAAGNSRLPDPPDWKYNRQSKKLGTTGQPGSMAGVAFGLSLVYTLLGPIVVGYGIGWLLENKGGRPGAAAAGLILGLILGFAAMVFLALRIMGKDDKP